MPWNDPRQRRGNTEFGLDLLNRRHRIAERRTSRQIEAHRHRWELALMVDREIRRLRHVHAHEGRYRHLLSGERRGEIELVEQARIRLQRRVDLQDDVIAVELREILRHLALADGVVDRRVDQRRLDAEACRPVAIDGQRRRGGVRLLIAGDVGELLQALGASPPASAPRHRARRDRRPAGCIGTGSGRVGRRP